MTEPFNVGCTGITGDKKSFLFEWLSLILKHWLSRGVFCEELNYCWQTEDIWGVLITESFNVIGTGINGDDKLLLFEWLSLLLKRRLSQGVVSFLPWLFLVPLLWRLTIPFGRGMLNAIWVCGDVVSLLICLFMSNESWEQSFWLKNFSHVWVSVPGIKLSTNFLSQYDHN